MPRSHKLSLSFRLPTKTLNTFLITKYMLNSPCEANSSPASEDIPRILRNPKVQYNVHKGWHLIPFLMTILILSSHLYCAS